MRSSIPELFFIMLVLIDQLIDLKNYSKKVKKIIGIVFILGAITPLVEFSRGVKYMNLYGKMSNPDDSVKSFYNINDKNFVGKDFKNSKFYKYFYIE